MKKIFYLPFFLFITADLFAQSPGGVNGSVLWLKANLGYSGGTWSDYSGLTNDFSQPSAVNQPLPAANVFNFNPGLQFDGSNTYLTQPAPSSFPEASNDRTIFVVANATLTNGYRWIFVYGTPGVGASTCQVGNNNGGVSNAFYGVELTTPDYWTAPANTAGAMETFTLNSNLGSQFDRGNLLQTVVFGPLAATSVNGIIGALSPSLAEPWSGSIAEIIMFNSALSNGARNQVETYLALKYGFTLGTSLAPIDYVASDATTYWTSPGGTYQNDIFGIGTDNGTGLIQIQSNSMNSGSGNGSGQTGKGNLVLSSDTPLDDIQFLMIGNDAGVLTEHVIATGETSDPAAEGSQRLVRNWQAQNTGSVGSVNLSFDTTGLTLAGGSVLTNFRLMIDQDGDGDYTTGTPVYITPSASTGNQLNFTGVTLNNNAVFTVITQASALLPALWQGFTVTLQKNTATLIWKTSNEINVDHYTAEYSTDGTSFKAAGTVTAKNGSGINTYSLVQENLPAGTRYYHIKRIDKDGRSAVSDVKSIQVAGVNTVVLKSNPIASGRLLELNVSVQQNQDAVIRVVNTNGVVMIQRNTSLSAGTNAVSANVSVLAAGIYFLQVQLGTEIINKKFVRL